MTPMTSGELPVYVSFTMNSTAQPPVAAKSLSVPVAGRQDVAGVCARADASTRRDARDYMDADELAEAVGADASALTTRKEYDTFGAAASQAAHAAADRERAAADGERPSVLPATTQL